MAVVLGMALGAQAATLTMSTDKATYLPGETITMTILGDSEGAEALGAYGSVVYDTAFVSSNAGSQTQTALKTAAGVKWIRGALATDGVYFGTQDAFSQINGTTVAAGTTKKLTAVMTFTADSAGTASFSWLEEAGGLNLNFFGLSSNALVNQPFSVDIIPEPSTAGLMGLGLIGLVLAGRRRKS
jgi:hypothetical protein